MQRRKWTITFSSIYKQAEEHYARLLAGQLLFAGLPSTAKKTAEEAVRNEKVFDNFRRAVSELSKPGKGPDRLPGAFDEDARPVPHFSKLEFRPWIAYFYLDTSDPESPHASGVILFHEDDEPESLRRALQAIG
jgi:hypothetical protein